jgi:hypothetical protein
LHRYLKARTGVARRYIYATHASICRMDTATIRTGDIADVLGSLQARIQDPAGNLRKDGDPAYGPAGNS